MPFPDASAMAVDIDPIPSQTVGLFSSHVPRELIHALGCTPVRVFPDAAKPTASEAYLPRNFCALNRLILASYLDREHWDLDGVIFADEDDAARRLHDVWRGCVDIPVWAFLEVPRSTKPLAISHFAEILSKVIPVLEGHSQNRLEIGALQRSIATYNEQRHLLACLKNRWLSQSLATSDYRRLRRAALTRDPAVVDRLLRSTAEEMTDPNPNENGTRPPDRPSNRRILLMAELAAPNALVRLVEACGARVVAEDSDLDERNVASKIPAQATDLDQLLRELALAYLAKPPGPRNRLLPERLAYLEQVVTERGVHGAICVCGKFCDLYLAEFPSVRSHLKRLGVPVLLLEVEDETISGQHRTRVEAFLEMMS